MFLWLVLLLWLLVFESLGLSILIMPKQHELVILQLLSSTSLNKERGAAERMLLISSFPFSPILFLTFTGANPALQNNLRARGTERPFTRPSPDQSGSTTSRSDERSKQPTASRYGSNIHTLKHDEDDDRFSDRNAFWNGNSTQYGGNNDGNWDVRKNILHNLPLFSFALPPLRLLTMKLIPIPKKMKSIYYQLEINKSWWISTHSFVFVMHNRLLPIEGMVKCFITILMYEFHPVLSCKCASIILCLKCASHTFPWAMSFS